MAQGSVQHSMGLGALRLTAMWVTDSAMYSDLLVGVTAMDWVCSMSGTVVLQCQMRPWLGRPGALNAPKG